MGKDRNPRASKNWQLRCDVCDRLFRDKQIAGDIRDHFDDTHPGIAIKTRLVWIGVGPEPKTRPSRWN